MSVRVRFCPSPTGNPHVGVIRAALYNWAFARHHGGTFVFRIEDTDAARDSEESYQQMLTAMRWLGLDWDEGPEVGGPFGPYRQSQRGEVYADVATRLRESGRAYDCYCSQGELEQRRELARTEGRMSGYDGHCRGLTAEQVTAYRAEGRQPVLRLRMPDEATGFDDLVRGRVSFDAEQVPDYVLVRANGQPLYPLVNPVDDALMGITHVLRGEDLLSSTPRQIALHHALREIGVAGGELPAYGHLPLVMGEGNRKLSKRDPESSLDLYRQRGFLPEGLLNYLALLGWSLGNDHEIFTLTEMAAAFDVSRVNSNPARFDLAKCEAVNATHLRLLAPDAFAGRLLPYVPVDSSGPSADLLAAAAPLVQERATTLSEAADLLGFLFVDEEAFTVDPDDAAKQLVDGGLDVVRAACSALSELSTWDTASIEQALRAALVEGMGLKPRHAFGPVRVAVTGRRISPPLFESLQLLGRDRSLGRLGRIG